MKTNMKTKVALLVITLFLTSLVSFGIGRHGKHERHGKFHKQEIKNENREQNSKDCKFADHKDSQKGDFQDREFNKDRKEFNKDRKDFSRKDFKRHNFNHRKFNREMIKNHKGQDLSFLGNTILLDEVIVYGKRI